MSASRLSESRGEAPAACGEAESSVTNAPRSKEARIKLFLVSSLIGALIVGCFSCPRHNLPFNLYLPLHRFHLVSPRGLRREATLRFGSGYVNACELY